MVQNDMRAEEMPGPPDGHRARASIGRWFQAPEWGLVAGTLALLAFIYVLDSNGAFFQVNSLRPLIHRVALYGVLSIGAAVVIIIGGIDLSTGSVVALASVFSAKLLTDWLPGAGTAGHPPSGGTIALAIGLTLLLGLAIGLFHALLINRFELPAFIATLATMAGLRSLSIVLCNSRTINVPYEGYRIWGSNPWFTVSIFAAVAVATSVLMGRTVLGRHLYALGGNENAARLSGLRTRRLKAIAYGLSGALSALGGILFTGLTGQGDSKLGVAYELTAITAAVVGGCSLAGGVGSISGTVLGLLLTRIVIKGTGVLVRSFESTQIEGLVLGTVVVLAVAFNQKVRLRKHD